MARYDGRTGGTPISSQHSHLADATRPASSRVITGGLSGVYRLLQGALRRPFVRDVGILQMGALAAAAIGFLSSIVLARTLGSEEYGVYALVVSIGTTIGLLRRLGQDHATTTKLSAALAREDAPGASMALSYFVAIGVWSALVVIPIGVILAPEITTRFFGRSQLAVPLQLYLVPVSWVVISATAGLALQCTRHIGQLTWMENGTTAALALAAIAGALLAATAQAVLLAQLLVSIIAALVGAAVYRWLQRRVGLLPDWSTLARGVVQPRFPVWQDTRSGLAMALDKNLATLYPLIPVLLLGAVSQTQDVAQLRIALSYVAIPALLLAPISRLLMVKLPDVHARSPERLRSFFVSVSLTGGLSSAALTAPFALLAPWLIPWLYGMEYGASIPLVLVLAIDSALLGLGLTAGPLFRTLHRTDLPIRVHLVVLALGAPLTFVLVNWAGALAAAACYVGLMLAVRLITNALCWRLLAR